MKMDRLSLPAKIALFVMFGVLLFAVAAFASTSEAVSGAAVQAGFHLVVDQRADLDHLAGAGAGRDAQARRAGQCAHAPLLMKGTPRG